MYALCVTFIQSTSPVITLIFCHYFMLNLVRNLWISLELCQDLRDQSTICSRYFLHTYSPQLSIESGRHNNSLALIGRSSIHLCLKYSSYRVLNTTYKIRKSWATTCYLINIWQMSWWSHNLNHDQTKHPTENFISQNLFKIYQGLTWA